MTHSAPLSVVVVNWNTRALLERCLRTVLEQTPDPVVVDNGSTDGSAEMVRRDFPTVRLEILPNNPGYGAAANFGISRSRAEGALLLNSDTELVPGAVQGLSDYLERHPHVGLVGPRLLNPDGTSQQSCFPFPRPLRPLTRNGLRGFRDTVSQRVPWVVGAALAIRRAAFDAVGGFDESYHMYFEEVDLAFRLAQAGWETHFTSDASVTHLIGASTGQRRPEMMLRTRLSARRYFRRHYAGLPLAAGLTLEYALTVGRLLRDLIRCGLARDEPERARLKEAVGVWWTLIRGSPAGSD